MRIHEYLAIRRSLFDFVDYLLDYIFIQKLSNPVRCSEETPRCKMIFLLLCNYLSKPMKRTQQYMQLQRIQELFQKVNG